MPQPKQRKRAKITEDKSSGHQQLANPSGLMCCTWHKANCTRDDEGVQNHREKEYDGPHAGAPLRVTVSSTLPRVSHPEELPCGTHVHKKGRVLATIFKIGSICRVHRQKPYVQPGPVGQRQRVPPNERIEDGAVADAAKRRGGHIGAKYIFSASRNRSLLLSRRCVMSRVRIEAPPSEPGRIHIMNCPREIVHTRTMPSLESLPEATCAVEVPPGMYVLVSKTGRMMGFADPDLLAEAPSQADSEPGTRKRSRTGANVALDTLRRVHECLNAGVTSTALVMHALAHMNTARQNHGMREACGAVVDIARDLEVMQSSDEEEEYSE